MPPNHVSAPALSLANFASVVVAAHQKRLVPQLPPPLLPSCVVNGARPFAAEALSSPQGTLLGTLTVLPALRMGLAQMAAAGRPTPAGLIAMPVPSSTVSDSRAAFYRSLAAVQTPITWDVWNAGTPRGYATTERTSRESSPAATLSVPAPLKTSEPQRAPVGPRMQHAARAAAQAPTPSMAAPYNAAACQQVWERIQAVRADWLLRDAVQQPTQRGLAAKGHDVARQGGTEALETADRVRAVRKVWHGREAEHMSSALPIIQPQATASPPPSPPAPRRVMAAYCSRTPDLARLSDLIRGPALTPFATLPHSPHRDLPLPQRSEFHPFGIKRALDRLRG